MKQNYNFNKNYKPPSSESIAKHQDFDALLNKFEAANPTPTQEATPTITAAAPKSNFKLLPIIGALAMAAALIGWFVFINTGKSLEEYHKLNRAHFAQSKFINPPFENVASAQFVSTKINANQGGVYEHETGSRLHIPSAAFIDKDGNAVQGEVDILYREFHDYVDFFIAGIPMTYDSAGVQYTLESAGMIEVYAEQNGKRVRMAPGKNLDVELISHVKMPQSLNIPPSYNIYRLDEEKRNWVFTEVDNIQLVEKESIALPAKQEFEAELASIKKVKEEELQKIETKIPLPQSPTKPKKTNGSNSVFDLDFKDNVELAGLYKNSLWQVSPRSNIKANEIMKNVENADIKKISSSEFEITFTAGNKQQIVLVNPVLTGADYENALADFNRQMQEFQRLKAKRDAQLAAEKAALEEKIAQQKAMANKSYEEKLAILNKAGNTHGAIDLTIQRKVINRFKATTLGIWNCDRPLPPDIQLLAASFVTDSGKKIENRTAYMIDNSLNTVNRFLATDDARLAINRNSQQLLWVVTSDNKIAVYRAADFDQIPQNENKHTFVLRVIDKELKDASDIREVLYL